MARHCHQASYVVADPFTNIFVFFMSESMRAVDPFIERIPSELHQEYLTDYMTEMLKVVMGEENDKVDGKIPFKHGIIVAFARKT
jgi:juvenile hormone acid methyltransferase